MPANKNLHIALVLRLFSASGGLELYALKLTEGLLAAGHKVTVICAKDESGLSHANLKVALLGDFDQSDQSAGADQNKAAVKKSKGDQLHYYYQTASNAVAQLGPFDIIHSQHFPVSPVDVVTFHNHTVRRLSQVGYSWERTLNNIKMALTGAYKTRDYYDAKLAREAKVRIFVGAVMRDDFYQAYGIEASAPYAVAHPGAGLSAAPATDNDNEGNSASDGNRPNVSGTSSNHSNRPFTFLFVGKGFRKKGLDTLLSSCRILKKRGHRFVLNIAGIKPRPLRLLQLRTAGLSDCVHYLGFRKDMDNVYAAADASILPSKIEPFGMAPIQGMQYGLVPIVSAISGVSEVLSDGVDSLILANHLDSAALADLMQRLILDRELYNRLQERAKPTADRINWRHTVAATLDAYDLALHSH